MEPEHVHEADEQGEEAPVEEELVPVEPEEDTELVEEEMPEAELTEEVPEGIPEETEDVIAEDVNTGGEDYGSVDDTNEGDNEGWERKRRQTETVAAQPMEIGIVHTKYGTVAAGPVLTGIAAGSEPQSAPVLSIHRHQTIQLH